MGNLIDNAWLVNILSGLTVSLILFITGYFIGKRREKRKQKGRKLEEYEFYPYKVDEHGFPVFDLEKFMLGVNYFIKNYDYYAARQLIIIGEQNNVMFVLNPDQKSKYTYFFKKYKGDDVMDENNEFLENYKNIVKHFGKTFRNLGVEILLHNLVNPSKSLTCLENPITGRNVGDGATALVLDLKKRKILNQDKINYELNIGSRKFKCTTVPIFRKGYGLVGAICINIDVNYISDEVLKSKEKLEYFFKEYCRTEMNLDENILSKFEYDLALHGKRHWEMKM